MRILVTGMTTDQRGSKNRRKINIMSPTTALVEGLRAAGHEVDWRSFTMEDWREDGGWDLQVVGVASVGSISVRRGLPGWLRLSLDIPTLVFWDDWKTYFFHANLGMIQRRGERYFKRKAFGTNFFMATDEELERDAPTAVAVGRRFIDDDFPANWHPLLLTFNWGDHDLAWKNVSPSLRPYSTIDPSYTTVEAVNQYVASGANHVEKSWRWLLTVLYDASYWLDRQGLQWPVDGYGPTGFANGYLKGEEQVIAAVDEHWGILAPPHTHAGSGWFRTRYIYAAMLGSVMLVDQRDGAALGPAYQYTASEIEEMSTERLASVSVEQWETLMPLLSSKEQFIQQLEVAISKAFYGSWAGSPSSIAIVK